MKQSKHHRSADTDILGRGVTVDRPNYAIGVVSKLYRLQVPVSDTLTNVNFVGLK